MKNATRLLALALTMLPLFAAAQLRSSDRIVTQVPFQFVMANKSVPAGEWTLQSASDGGRTLLLNNVDAKMSLFASASAQDSKHPSGASALVFHKYGDQYFLSEVKIGGSNTIYRVSESKAEAEMVARNVTPTETILLASVK